MNNKRLISLTVCLILATVPGISSLILADIASETDTKAQQHFEKANELRKVADYDAAITEYKRVISLSSNSKIAQDAQYWIGQSYFGAGQSDAALSAFQKLLDEYPASTIIPSTKLMIERIQQTKKNKSLFEAVKKGDIEQVKSFISSGADVSTPDTDPFGTTPLFYAVSNSHAVIAEMLIAHGADVNARRKLSRHAPLHIAAAKGDERMVRLLISSGANINAAPASQATPLHRAATQGHKEVVRILIEAGARSDLRDWEGKTALYAAMIARGGDSREIVELLAEAGAKLPAVHLAAFVGNVEEVRACIKKGTSVNARDDCESTPLHAAVNGGQAETVGFLIDNGADVKARDNYGRVALHLAAKHGYADITTMLLAHAADLHDRCQSGMSPLHYAAAEGHDEIVRLLLDKGADINATPLERRTPRRGTPLHQAVSWCHRSTAELLIMRGADVNARDVEDGGQTPLVWAVWEGDVSEETETIAALLIDKGADVNVRDSDGDTPLHEAAWISDGMVKLLLSKGADVNAKDIKLRTPLHTAAQSGLEEAVRTLISHGADIDARDNAGRTPMSLAKEEGHQEIVELLKKHGAKE